MLRVSEIYSAYQGEGVRMGERMTVLRLGGCNLNCFACDTPQRDDWTTHAVEDVAEKIVAEGNFAVLITGGEPTLQMQSIIALMSFLPWNYCFDLETNGEILVEEKDLRQLRVVTISPKLFGLMVHEVKEVEDSNLGKWQQYGGEECDTKYVYKFSVTADSLRVGSRLEDLLGLLRNEIVIIQPLENKGGTKETTTQFDEILKLQELLAEKAPQNFAGDVRILPRLHTLLYDMKTRGV